jgi:RNA:NAD 2'-phosphotransferase (TPT1/KptA family)
MLQSIRAMYGHIKEVKTANKKGSAKQEDESVPLLA